VLRWLLLISLTPVLAQTPTTKTALQAATGVGMLQRRYVDGAITHYVMTGDNDSWQYTIHATVVVKRDTNRRYYEEIRWSDLTSNAGQVLTPASLALAQTLSLDDPVSYMKVPNLASVQPLLIGPITDTLTLYSDLLLAMQAKLVQPGQAAYVARTTPNSWADGHYVLLGQDVVDFSLKVEKVDSAEHTETLLIQHVPPAALHIQLPAKWMQQPASDKPPNFVQVSRHGDGFTAAIGRETFDVRLVVDTRDGRILSAAMHNPVALATRECADQELTHCEPANSKTTLREITWKLVP
jgi:hypothetical protein